MKRDAKWYPDDGRRVCPECGEASNAVTAYLAPDPPARRYVNGWKCPNGHQWETPQ